MNNQTTPRIELMRQFLEASGHMYRCVLPVKTKFFTELALNRSQFELMMFVARSENPTIKEIAQALTISSSAATQLVEGLVQRGLVDRIDSDSDRRVVNVRLSKNGEMKRKTFKKLVYSQLTKKLTDITDEELIIMKRIADKISLALSENTT